MKVLPVLTPFQLPPPPWTSERGHPSTFVPGLWKHFLQVARSWFSLKTLFGGRTLTLNSSWFLQNPVCVSVASILWWPFRWYEMQIHNAIVFWYRALPSLKRNYQNVPLTLPGRERPYWPLPRTGPKSVLDVWTYGKGLCFTQAHPQFSPSPLHPLHVSDLSLLTPSLELSRNCHLVSWPELTLWCAGGILILLTVPKYEFWKAAIFSEPLNSG